MTKLSLPNLYTESEAGKILGLEKSTVVQMIRVKKLHPVKVGMYNYLPLSEIQRYQNERRKAGGQPGNKNCKHGKNLLPERIPLETRLFAKIIVDPITECWNWQGAKTPFGYGQVKIHKHAEIVHRTVYEIKVGPIPEGVLLLHKCDNPPCCNPDHLFLGSYLDNSQDMINKGRQNKNRVYLHGSDNPSAKLTESDIVKIRNLHKSGITRKAIARQFGITKTNVYWIINRKTWKHVP